MFYRLKNAKEFAIAGIAALGIILSLGIIGATHRADVSGIADREPVQTTAVETEKIRPPAYGTEQNAVLDTSTWKTYRNEKYGFEFMYPPEFVLSGVLSGDIRNSLALGHANSDPLIRLAVVSKGIVCQLGEPENRCRVAQASGDIDITFRWIDIAPYAATIEISPQAAFFGIVLCKSYPGSPTQGVSFCEISPKNKKLFEEILSTFRFVE